MLANKPNSLPQRGTQLQLENWQIVEQAKIKQNDKEDAEHASNEIMLLELTLSK